MPPTTPLYRPVNQQELDLIAGLGWQAFPPRLPEQPIFYPVLNEAYAAQISRDWNVPFYGMGYVVRFAVDTAYLARFPVQNVGDQQHDELWVPAEQLAEFNQHIAELIEVIAEFRRP
ncbi:ADP-ribosylation/crystallin J1 [Hymenobacter sp. BT664]|uniref:ADP-ribosylation/crystallin J1 n=1 Tax=Hymenobacter montanus TaxID=2771359 RepID=A0A927BEC5_9BACT|nr:ADP-ribosylation/crystallin J1 [Hymenobacter montanus]MBD2768720.1 ADP-ribosylation/crystallin J1 [Hymenobacter montanus]